VRRRPKRIGEAKAAFRAAEEENILGNVAPPAEHSWECSALPSTALGREPGGGLVVPAFTVARRGPIISAAARNNVPAVYSASEFARDGGLLSYGNDRVDNWRRLLCRSHPARREAERPSGAVSDQV
jgi:hypothetical protein